MTTKLIFHGGPLDGRTERRVLAPLQTEFRCLLGVPPHRPFDESRYNPIQTGRYEIIKRHEGIAVLRWLGTAP